MDPRTIRLVDSILLTPKTINSQDNTDYIYDILSKIINGLKNQYGLNPDSSINDSERFHLNDEINKLAERYFERSGKSITSLKLGAPSIEIPVERSLDTYEWDCNISDNNNYTFVIKSFTQEVLWHDTIGDKILISLKNSDEEGFLKTSLVELTENLSIANLKL
ncbi:MAG: hypothetical protein ACK4E0_06480 [Chitinophagaceae bacterium]